MLVFLHLYTSRPFRSGQTIWYRVKWLYHPQYEQPCLLTNLEGKLFFLDFRDTDVHLVWGYPHIKYAVSLPAKGYPHISSLQVIIQDRSFSQQIKAL